MKSLILIIGIFLLFGCKGVLEDDVELQPPEEVAPNELIEENQQLKRDIFNLEMSNQWLNTQLRKCNALPN